MNFDVIIIGGGVLGVSTAYHLAKQNKRVLILEREELLGSHASGKNAGMFRQLYRHPQLTEWAYRSRTTWPEKIKKNTFKETGSFVVGRNVPNHHQFIFEQTTYYENNSELPAVFTATDGILDSCSYLQMLVKETDKQLVTFKTKSEVVNLNKEKGTWFVETKSGEIFSAEWIINCAGAWVNNFLNDDFSNSKLNVSAYARHLFLIKGWDKDYMPQQNCGFYWDEANAWYLRIWSEEERLVSICDKEHADPDNFVPKSNLTLKVSEKLFSTQPNQFEKLSIGRSWHCFRTYAPDQLPVWGEDQIHTGLFWLAAFGGFGMSTSFAASEDAVKYICNQPIEISKDFLPNRVQNIESKNFAIN